MSFKNLYDTNSFSPDIALRNIRQNNQDRNLSLIKGFSFFNYENLKINNDYIYYKILNYDILFFIKFLNPVFFFKIFKIFKLIFFIYISFIIYEIFHKYISLIKSWRKINWKHILSLFWRLYSYKFKFFSFFFKIFIKFKFNKIFKNVFLINYGFLSFYYLEIINIFIII